MKKKKKKTRKYHDPGDPVRALEFQNRRSIHAPRICCGHDYKSSRSIQFFNVFHPQSFKLYPSFFLFLLLSNNIYRDNKYFPPKSINHAEDRTNIGQPIHLSVLA